MVIKRIFKRKKIKKIKKKKLKMRLRDKIEMMNMRGESGKDRQNKEKYYGWK